MRALVKGGGWGIATFNSLDTLPERVQQAYDSARVVQAEPIALAEVSAAVDDIRVTLDQDFRQIPLERKKEVLEGYNDILLSYPQVIDTQATYADQFITVTYANSEGAYIREERPMATTYLMATARDGDNVQRGFDGLSLPGGYERMQRLDALAQKVGQSAVDMLSAEDGGRRRPTRWSAIPSWPACFIHEAFGHLSEADFVYANPQAQEMMQLGRRFGNAALNVVDDGSLPGLRGSHRYDDEGALCRRNELIPRRRAGRSAPLARDGRQDGRGAHRQRSRRGLSLSAHRTHDQHLHRAR